MPRTDDYSVDGKRHGHIFTPGGSGANEEFSLSLRKLSVKQDLTAEMQFSLWVSEGL